MQWSVSHYSSKQQLMISRVRLSPAFVYQRTRLQTCFRSIVTASKSQDWKNAASSSSQQSQESGARAFRALPVAVINVSKNSSTAAQQFADEYAEKIRRYLPFTATTLRTNPKKASSTEVAKNAEGEKVLQALKPQDRVVLLCERGREVTSEGIARIIAEAGDSGCSRLVFCIGGPFGHAAAVADRADESVRLSKMVLNHTVANIVLLEQIYRGLTILSNQKYHH